MSVLPDTVAPHASGAADDVAERSVPSPAAELSSPESAPVAAVLDFVGSTLADYDRLLRTLFLTPGGPGLPGCLFHWARATADGIRVSEVWRDEATFHFYLREEVLPLTSYLRLAPPEVQLYPVHSYLIDGPAHLLPTPPEDG